jgi:hypothetical protein
VLVDLEAGRSLFRASNGFTIEARVAPGRFLVTVKAPWGEEVPFDVAPPRAHGPHASRLEMHLGDATFRQRIGVPGEATTVEIESPRRGRARHADLIGQIPELRGPGAHRFLEMGRSMEALAAADVRVYEILREVALDQAGWGFWQGLAGLAQELEVAARDVDPATCFWACGGCVIAILNWIANTGAIAVACNPAGAPLCILAILRQASASGALLLACGGCGVCIQKKED